MKAKLTKYVLSRLCMAVCSVILFAHALQIISIRNDTTSVQQLAQKFVQDEPYRISLSLAILDFERIKFSKWLGVHVWPVPIWLFCAFFQTSSTIRRKHLHLHRWIGRLFLLVSVWMTVGYAMMFIAGEKILGDEQFYVDFQQPNKFFTFRAATIFFSGWWVLSAVKAYMYARQKLISKHKYWAWQFMATGFAVAVMRIFMFILVALLFSGSGHRVMEKEDQDILGGYTLWLGFIVSIAVTHIVVGSEVGLTLGGAKRR